jgi:thiol-disulfide isomerase/thioredoxin
MRPTVTVFVARGCGACHAFVPVLRRMARHYPQVQVHIVEISGGRGATYAQHERIRGTPTTIVHTARGTTVRRVGALPANDIQRLFETAVR